MFLYKDFSFEKEKAIKERKLLVHKNNCRVKSANLRAKVKPIPKAHQDFLILSLLAFVELILSFYLLMLSLSVV